MNIAEQEPFHAFCLFLKSTPEKEFSFFIPFASHTQAQVFEPNLLAVMLTTTIKPMFRAKAEFQNISSVEQVCVCLC